jgi:hypothetical protein
LGKTETDAFLRLLCGNRPQVFWDNKQIQRIVGKNRQKREKKEEKEENT